MKYLLLFIILFISLINVYGQSITWQRTFVYDEDRKAFMGFELLNGNYFMSGWRYNGIRGNDIYILDKFGNLVLEKNHTIYGRRSAIQLPDTSIWIGGDDIFFNGPSIWKLDKNYDSVWVKEYGNSTGSFFKLKKLDNNSILACGSIYTNPTRGYLARVNTAGELMWQVIIDSSANMRNLTFYDLAVKDSNNIFILCKGIFGSAVDVVIYKINSTGSILTSKRINTSYNESIMNNIIYYNNSLYICGQPQLSGYRSYLIKLNSNFDTIFYKIYSERTERMILSDNTIVLAGSSTTLINEPAARAIDTNGNQLWYRTINNGYYWTYSYDLALTKNGGVFYTGDIYDSQLDRNSVYALRTDSSFRIDPIGIKDKNILVQDFNINYCYPNPFNSKIKLKYTINKKENYILKIYDCNGRFVNEVFNKQIEIGEYEETLEEEFNELSSSVFFIKLFNNNFSDVKKIIYLK